MTELTKSEAMLLIAGASISGTLINSFAGGIKIILEVGRSLGTAIRRLSFNCMCKL